jgi:hypothetical protein
MNLARLPLVSSILESGADDRIFDGLLLCGPVVIALIAVLGRTPVTVGLAGGYLVLFAGYLLYKGTQ